MSNTIDGRVIRVSTPNERVTASDRSWAKDFFVIENSHPTSNGEIVKQVKFDVISSAASPRWKDWNLSEGDFVEVFFSVKSHLYEGNGKWYTEVTAYAVNKTDKAPVQFSGDGGSDDDFPF